MENASAPAASASAPATPAARQTATVTLHEPIVRGESKIETLTLRKPKAGELRGLSIQELMNARVSSTLDLLPRITMPPITQQEADDLEPTDLMACSGNIIGFFLTPTQVQTLEEEASKQ